MADYNDPFADEPADEAQNHNAANTNESPWEDTPVANSNNSAQPVVVNAGSEGKVVVTLKGGKEFDKPWVVIHAQDVDDALDQLNHDRLKELLKVSQSAAGFFVRNGSGGADASGASQQRQSGGGQNRRSGKPDGADNPSSGETRTCKHGEMVYRTGFSQAKQKTWEAFFCPTPKGTQGQCKPQFLD